MNMNREVTFDIGVQNFFERLSIWNEEDYRQFITGKLSVVSLSFAPVKSGEPVNMRK